MNAITLAAAGLLIVGSVLNLAVISRSPASDKALPWRARWVAQVRRYPLLRGAAVACLLAAAALFLVDIVVNHS